MEINLANKTIVVTGSSRGIGSELVIEYAKLGANVVINYHQSDAQAEKLLYEVEQFNQNCIMVKADLKTKTGAEKLYKKTLERFGKVDVLVNNAGMCDDNLLQLMTEKKWCSVMELNLYSLFYCCRVFSKNMIRNRQGKIINIASLKGQIGCEGQTNYSSSKAGVIGFTKALAKELGRFNISVNAVCPGFIPTDMNKDNLTKVNTAKKISVLDNVNYLDCLINFMVFMVSDHFHSITGQVYNLDSRLR